MCILQSIQVEINGKFANVEQVHLGRDRQDIAYRINGKLAEGKLRQKAIEAFNEHHYGKEYADTLKG